ncbi:MAG: TetR/AcrR family transcriptional regulator [Bacteroidales bacterium]|nr:TetR/AcrR family transcriptional regulator [Clostridium sp.]MCM1202877.1 TetR/AcrR family transcriptional regulator [Bacteroidales bacterium]
MGKLEDNKKRKKEAIVNSAFALFIQNGINDTSIADIMKKAELAKGTFYLYFKDKFEVRDYLIRKKATALFERAQLALDKSKVDEFEEKIIFMVDDILNQLNENKVLLRFISKNLSWGIFKHAITNMSVDRGLNAEDFLEKLFSETDKKYRNPEMLMFMITELVNSTAHNVILYKQPVELEELKETLYPLIRQMIHNFEITE